MLSRVARQKNVFLHLRRTQALRAPAHLPTTRFHSCLSKSPLINSSCNSIHDRSRNPSAQTERRLATAADHSSIDSPSSESYDNFMNMPFDSLNTSSLIVLEANPQSHSKIFRRRHGVGGDEIEMRANLDVSLKVGHFERAAALITRLGHYHPPGSPEYLTLHNRYLQKMVTHMILNREQDMVLPLQKWFEIDMPAGGVTPDAITFAIMIRMSLRMLHGSKRDRTVRRYWELAQDADLQEEIVGIEILDDSDVGELSKVRLFFPICVLNAC